MSTELPEALAADLEGLPHKTRSRVALFRLLLATGGRLRVLMDRRLARVGLTTQQAAIMNLIANASSPISQRELASAIGTTHQNVKQLTTSLVNKGLLEVRTDEKDRRIRRMVATPAFRRRRSDVGHTEVAQWFASLTDKQVNDTIEAMNQLLRSIAS
jgi:DNA-binding MarR family transcriptional regulator